MPTKTQKEYIDIPLRIEATPIHQFGKMETYVLPKTPMDIAFDFLCRIETALKAKDNQIELYRLQKNYFQVGNNTVFLTIPWPTTFQIQAQHPQKQQLDSNAQLLYNQLILRNKFTKSLHNQSLSTFLNIVDQSSQVYNDIFTQAINNINFHPNMIWQLFQNFLNHLTEYHLRAKTIPADSIKQQWFNISESKKKLQNIILGLKGVEQISQNITSKEIFAYYAILASAMLEVYEGQYDLALKLLSRLSLTDILPYTLCLSALLCLFRTAAYSYFLQQHYKQSARLSQLFINFYQKNKKHFSTLNNQQLSHFESIVSLLCLNYVFLEQKPKPVIMEVFKTVQVKSKDKLKEKIADKHYKLRQNDNDTFRCLFESIVLPTLDPNNKQTLLNLVQNRFHNLQSITLNTILQHYTQISINKIVKMLNMSQDNVIAKIQSFNAVPQRITPWDRTIIGPLMSQTHKVHIEIDADLVVKLDTQDNENSNQWEQYREEVAWLVNKIDAL